MLDDRNKSISFLYFHINSSRKNSIVLPFNMAALSRGCKPRIVTSTNLEYRERDYDREKEKVGNKQAKLNKKKRDRELE